MSHLIPAPILLVFVVLLAITAPLSAGDIDRNGDGEVNVLVVGNTHSFSEGGESGVVHEKPFNPTAISTQLQSILSLDTAISETVNVEFEDIYKTKSLTVNYSGSQVYDFTSRCYSLAQHYMWPEGKAARLANLRGADSTAWDYVILMADSYVMANFSGMYAEGVKLMVDEIKQGTAEPILFAQWPENASSFTALNFNETVYRVGNSAGVTVIPGGKVWSTLADQDSPTSHPTPKGAYLAAASIYSELCSQSAKASSYVYSNQVTTDATADHALAVIQASQNTSQYSGAYAGNTVFSMKYVNKRTINFRETGTSTEDRIRQALNRVDERFRVSFTTAGSFWDFNYGRGNDWWEDNKDYEVDPAQYDRSYGFPMHHYTVANAIDTMPYGIDKHYYFGSSYEDGTDLGIAYNMIRPGTRELSLPEDVRAVPIRLLWLKMSEQAPGFNPLGDNTHMHPNLNDATAAFMYTQLSGRCPIVDEPADSSSSAWMEWLGHKVGYETAWQMSHLTTRSPGFQVFPSATSATSITPTTTETMTVRFMNPPESDVTVNVICSSPIAAILGPKTLVFTPSNYNTAQQVTVAGIPGTSASESFDVVYSTSSNDEIFNGLSDSWNYSNIRSSTESVSQTDNGVSSITVIQDTPVAINLNAAGANAGNTVMVGPSYGSVSWTSDSVIEYIPNNAYAGSDLIVYASTVGGVQTIGCVDITVEVPSGQVNVEITDGLAAEQGSDSGIFTIRRLGETSSALNVLFSMNGTSVLGSDYTLSQASPVTIPAGQSSVAITLTPVDDSVFGERFETATLTIIPDAAYPIGTGFASVTITDNDNNAPEVDAGSDQILEWQVVATVPGLYYGTVLGNIDTSSPNPETEILIDVASRTEDNIAGSTTEIYTGNIYDADGQISFTEHIDDKARIWIDGVLVLSNDSWNSRSSTINLNLFPGWHTIEIRISNGGGGSGRVSGVGIGYDPAGGTEWQTLVDSGDGSFLRVNQNGGGADVTLSAIVSDLDADPLTVTWSRFAGPGPVTFGNALAVDTTASFTQPGSYVIRLTVGDGLTQTTDDVEITVNPPLSSIYTAWASGDFTHPFTDIGGELNGDGDHINNLLEFAFGTDPTESDGYSLVPDGSVNGQPMPVSGDGGATFEFFFMRRDDHGNSGSLTYIAQFSSDLVTFYDSAVNPSFVSDSSDDSDYEVVKVPYPATLPNGQKGTFGRIRVNMEP